MYSSIVSEGSVENRLSWPSVLLRGTTAQDKFSIDVGVTRPAGEYVYRATMVDASIHQPYRQVKIGNQPTSIITPQHIDSMLANLVRIHFNEEVDPRSIASTMNWELYKQLYQYLVKPALPPDTSWA